MSHSFLFEVANAYLILLYLRPKTLQAEDYHSLPPLCLRLWVRVRPCALQLGQYFEHPHPLGDLMASDNPKTQRIPMNHDQWGLSQTPAEYFTPHQTQAEKYHCLWTKRESEEAGLLGNNWLIRTEQTPQRELYRMWTAQRIRLFSLLKICWNTLQVHCTLWIRPLLRTGLNYSISMD